MQNPVIPKFLLLTGVLLCAMAGALGPAGVGAQPTASAQPAAADVTPDRWPKITVVSGTQYTVYQPQLENWDGYRFAGRVAVSVLPAGAPAPVFGVITVSAATDVDRLSRVVRMNNVRVTSSSFPSAPGSADTFGAGLQNWISDQVFAPSLDQMQAALGVESAANQTKGAVVQNDPPNFVFSDVAAALVHIDGEPVWQTVDGTPLSRVINTRALILRDPAGKVYLHLLDGFVEAPSLGGPWLPSAKAPPAVVSAQKALVKTNTVDLMEGAADETTKKKPSLKAGMPRVVIATTPTELILTRGAPDWQQIKGVELLYLANTSGNVFKSLRDQFTYVLVTGRWFKARDFSGPWVYIDGSSLPPDFAAISDDSPKENVMASIPGTPQAKDAVIANQIPQTARVYRAQAKFTPQISGNPQLKPIAGTSLSYVFNSPTPIIQVTPAEWYAEHSGVWFSASSLAGPWVVAIAVPPAVYTIPPSSPVYYVTYVKVYEVTPTYVVVGYTPGYMGTIVTANGVVVYGTGYSYAPYVGPAIWYGAPVTYGYAANPTWTPWTGWAIGFGLGWYYGASSTYYCYTPAPYWGPMPYSPYYYPKGVVQGPNGGAAAWGPGGWAATTGNVYQKWGPTTAVSRTSAGYNAWTGNAWSSKVGTSYNSTTGRVSAGQQASVANVYTGNYANAQRGATYNPNTGVGVKAGSATIGNSRTGQSTTAKGAKVSGPNGQQAGVAKVGDNAYAGKDGNVYKNTGDGWQKYDGSGNWNDVKKPAGGSPPGNAGRPPPTTLPAGQASTGQSRTAPTTESLDAQKSARQAGNRGSASSAWGSESWGGGFKGGTADTNAPSDAASKARPSGTADKRQSWGGGEFKGSGGRSGNGNGGAAAKRRQ